MELDTLPERHFSILIALIPHLFAFSTILSSRSSPDGVGNAGRRGASRHARKPSRRRDQGDHSCGGAGGRGVVAIGEYLGTFQLVVKCLVNAVLRMFLPLKES